jgi:hypothetical protein
MSRISHKPSQVVHPFGFAAAVLSVALLGRFFPTAYGWWFTSDLYSTQVVLWLFVLGWMIHRATTSAQRWAAAAATLVLVPTFFGADALRTVIVVVGLLLLLFRPTLTVPPSWWPWPPRWRRHRWRST